MEKSLTDILKEALISKKIKLYKVLDKMYNPQGLEYYIPETGILAHPKKCVITGESHGFIKSLETDTVEYEGDWYSFIIVDDEGKEMNVQGLNSITSKFEII
jgi:hypothetical protein